MPVTSHILLVDDDPDVLEAMTFVLEDAGYDVSTAHDGAEALRRLRAGPHPCVILLDLMMPVMNGWQFRAEQRRDPDLAQIPLVVVTGAGPAAAQWPEDAQQVLDKPVRLSTLLETVKHYCRPLDTGRQN